MSDSASSSAIAPGAKEGPVFKYVSGGIFSILMKRAGENEHVIIHTDYICHYSPVIKALADKHIFEYELETRTSDSVMNDFAQWLYTQTFEGQLSSEDALTTEDINVTSKDEHAMILMPQLRAVHLLSQKYRALRVAILGIGGNEWRTVFVDTWACILLSLGDDAMQRREDLLKALESKGLLVEVTAAMLKKIPQQAHIWGEHDNREDEDGDGLPSASDGSAASHHIKSNMDQHPRESESIEVMWEGKWEIKAHRMEEHEKARNMAGRAIQKTWFNENNQAALQYCIYRIELIWV
ncbi:hypothetical protein B0J14DRAFT_564798 [Halenospora varia]|nr:hypothetical protein B0J14DRAFT_564798 [Halenospora varia]